MSVSGQVGQGLPDPAPAAPLPHPRRIRLPGLQDARAGSAHAHLDQGRQPHLRGKAASSRDKPGLPKAARLTASVRHVPARRRRPWQAAPGGVTHARPHRGERCGPAHQCPGGPTAKDRPAGKQRHAPWGRLLRGTARGGTNPAMAYAFHPQWKCIGTTAGRSTPSNLSGMPARMPEVQWTR